MKHTLRVSSQAGKIFFCAWQIYLASMCQPRLDPATAVISCGDPRYNWLQSCRSAEALSHDLNCHFLRVTVASFWRIPQAAFSLSLSHSYKSGRDGVTHEIGEHRHGLVPARHARGRKSMDVTTQLSRTIHSGAMKRPSTCMMASGACECGQPRRR